MGKVICLINSTPDGFCDSQYVIADAEFHEFVHSILANTHTIAFGRNTFELFQQVWPSIFQMENPQPSQLKMASALDEMPKTVYSSTLATTTWNNSIIVKTIKETQIRELKKENQKDLLTIGSPGLVASLTELQLVDEYYFAIQPAIAGGGNIRMFDKIKLETRLPLKVIGTKHLQSGVIIINYQRA